jgi:hypothetical protein
MFGGMEVVLWKAQIDEGAEKRKCERWSVTTENFEASEKRCKG